MGNVLITGAGSGLGQALAEQYAKAGHTVYLAGRTERKLLLVQKELRESGSKAEVLICDVSEPASVEECLKQLESIDILINNAGIGIFGDLASYRKEQMDQMLHTNVLGTVLMTQMALPKLKLAEGRVLNIISTAGLRGKTNESVYCASKFAVRGFTESLHKEWENEPLSATAVYMGGMNTPFWDESDHVKDPSGMKTPDVVAKQIFQEDDRREAIYIDR
ncbi:SDR family oxidoreductase [Halobacillus salinarum]|uniref:SDR family oxidoreductase n=1 Tax=Halobacillus salinarum TaxID=2932257 RepID=A0ABY4EJ52_9BACI|nr:SDR family oxidoreductase [Halobacillus salinarum]UOQ43664.1 SDR family oxidoreductase [Halobacillus salinarum]